MTGRGLVGGLKAEVLHEQLVAVGRGGAVEGQTIQAGLADGDHHLAAVGLGADLRVGEHLGQLCGVFSLAEQHLHRLPGAPASGIEGEFVVACLGDVDFREEEVVVGVHRQAVFIGHALVGRVILPGLAILVCVYEAEKAALGGLGCHLERHSEAFRSGGLDEDVADIERDAPLGGVAVDHHIIFPGGHGELSGQHPVVEVGHISAAVHAGSVGGGAGR